MRDRGANFLIEAEPGIELAVQDLGEGRPVVLIAGFGLDHRVWDSQVRQLVEAGLRAVCVDLRGTGGSSKPLGGYEVDRLAADVAAVVSALDLKRATLAGWSFGGQVCFRLAASMPDRVERLALIASNGVRASRGEGYPFGQRPEDSEPGLIASEKKDRMASRRQTIAAAFHENPDPEVLDFLVRCSLDMPSWAAVACYGSMLRTDLLEDLPRIGMPVLQLYGASDPALSAKGAAWLAEQLPDSRIAELPDCGHFPMFESPEAFDSALLGFVG